MCIPLCPLAKASPQEVLGWLLRRAGLPNSVHLNVQAAAGKLLEVRRHRDGHEINWKMSFWTRIDAPSRRQWWTPSKIWMEEQGHWSMLLLDEEDMTEILEATEVHCYEEDHSLDEEPYPEDPWPADMTTGRVGVQVRTGTRGRQPPAVQRSSRRSKRHTPSRIPS